MSALAVIHDDYLIYKVSRASTQETHGTPAFLLWVFLKGEQDYHPSCYDSQERAVASWHPGSHSAAEQMVRFSEDSLCSPS